MGTKDEKPRSLGKVAAGCMSPIPASSDVQATDPFE